MGALVRAMSKKPQKWMRGPQDDTGPRPQDGPSVVTDGPGRRIGDPSDNRNYVPGHGPSHGPWNPKNHPKRRDKGGPSPVNRNRPKNELH